MVKAAFLLLALSQQQQPQPDGKFTMAMLGDAIITRRLSPYQEPEFVRMIQMIRNADAAFANLEILFHDYEPYPMHESGGTYMRAEPALARELVWAGIDIVGMANNHTGDYGTEGHRLTRKYAEAAGLVTAGTGENLSEAREARFLETHEGRVALVSVASTFPVHSAAGRARGAVRGRPGLSPLRHERTRIVARADFDKLRATGLFTPAQGDRLNVYGTTVLTGDSSFTRTTPNA